MKKSCKNCIRLKVCKNCNHFDKCVRVYNLYSCCNDYEAKPLTEQEWLQTATTEQLAEFLACVEARKDADYDEETKAWAAWLKQPHREE